MKFSLEIVLIRSNGFCTTRGPTVDIEVVNFKLYWPIFPSLVRKRAEAHAESLLKQVRERVKKFGGHILLSACLYEIQGSWLFGLKTYR